MKLFSSNRTKRAVITSVMMLTIAAGGIGVGLYMNSQSGTQETRSAAYEDTSCTPGERTSCTKSFGSCSESGTKTCQADGAWGLCKADDPRLQNCYGRECGDDGCGGVCGLCQDNETCDSSGKCVSSGSSSSTPTPTQPTEEYPVVGGQNIQVRIEMQSRSNQSREGILLQLLEDDAVINEEEVSSGSDGITEAWDVSDLGTGTYTLRVKPLGFLSQTKEITLVDDNSLITFTEEFLAGDITGGSGEWGDDVVKSNDLVQLEDLLFTQENLADFDGDGYVKARDRTILEGNLLKLGAMPVE